MPKRKHTSAAPDELDPKTAALIAWLRSSGAEGLDDLVIRPDGTSGGLGVFAKRNFKAGARIASLPQSCVLSARAAEESELGKAVRAAASAMGPTCESLCTEEIVLWVFLAVGRVDAAHPWHAYLAALPGLSPEPTCWPAALRQELAATPVGKSVGAALEAVQAAFDGLVGRLQRKLPELIPEDALSLETLLWARGMLRSRSRWKMPATDSATTAHLVAPTVRTPERSLRGLEARRGPSSPPPAAPRPRKHPCAQQAAAPSRRGCSRRPRRAGCGLRLRTRRPRPRAQWAARPRRGGRRRACCCRSSTCSTTSRRRTPTWGSNPRTSR